MGGSGDKAMKGVYKQAMQMAQEQWNIYKEMFLPYQQAMMAANQEAMQWGSQITAAQAQQQLGLIPLRGELTEAGLKGAIPVTEEYFKQALEGPDVEARLGDVTADVSQVFKKARQNAARTMSRMGYQPGGQRMAGAFARLAGQEALAEVSGRQTTRRQAEEEGFQRLAQAMGYSAGQQMGQANAPWSYGSPGMQTGIGSGMMSTALGAAQGMGGGGFGQFAGGLFGKLAGSAVGGMDWSSLFSKMFGSGGGSFNDLWATYGNLD